MNIYLVTEDRCYNITTLSLTHGILMAGGIPGSQVIVARDAWQALAKCGKRVMSVA